MAPRVEETLPTDALVVEATEAEVRKVMAQRVALRKVPATHKQRAEMLAWIDDLLGRYALLAWGPAPWRE